MKKIKSALLALLLLPVWGCSRPVELESPAAGPAEIPMEILGELDMDTGRGASPGSVVKGQGHVLGLLHQGLQGVHVQLPQDLHRDLPDMALYGHQEQEEKWTGWCQAYFAGKNGSNE